MTYNINSLKKLLNEIINDNVTSNNINLSTHMSQVSLT